MGWKSIGAPRNAGTTIASAVHPNLANMAADFDPISESELHLHIVPGKEASGIKSDRNY